MRSSRLAAGVITGLLISVVPAHAQMAKRPMTFADIMELKNVGSVADLTRRIRARLLGERVGAPERAPIRRPRRKRTRRKATVTTFADTSGSFRRLAGRRDSSRSANAASPRRRGRLTAARLRLFLICAWDGRQREDADLDSADGRGEAYQLTTSKEAITGFAWSEGWPPHRLPRGGHAAEGR